MKPKPTGIESIALRRAVIADSDKVRYKVYSSPTEFIAVIAESALMAVKVSGITKPHKIVRDLPTEGIAIEAKKMAEIDPSLLRVSLPTERIEKEKQLITELAMQKTQQTISEENFKPMNIADLQHNGKPRARILPPDMLSEIIEQHAKATMPAPASPEPVVAQPLPEVAAPVVEEVPPAAPALPELSTEEKIVQMADDVLAASAVAEPTTPAILSPNDVEKLLNE